MTRVAQRLRGGGRLDRVLAAFGNVAGTCYAEAASPAGGLASATLSAGVSIGDTTVTVSGQLARACSYTIDSETVTITDVAGTAAPYTCTLASALTVAHSSGAAVTSVDKDYTLYKPIGNGRYAFWTFEWFTKRPPYTTGTVSGYGLNQIHNAGVALVAVRSSRDDASMTRTGTWTTGIQAQLAFAGGYRWSATAGDTVTWVSPTSGTAVAWEGVGTNNGPYDGLAIVSIDGDKTAATALPTAQQGVDSGLFPSGLLVANGGPASPTDRILDPYWPLTTKYSNRKLLAAGLTNTAHTVVLTVTGFADTRAPTGTRVSYSALAVGSSATALSDTNAAAFPETWTQDSQFWDSAWERADQEAEPGGTQTFIGHIHGYERQTSLALSLAGSPVVIPVGSTAVIDRIDRQSTTNHPDNPSHDTATCVTAYDLTSRGLEVTDTKTLLRDMSIVAIYMMMPNNGTTSASQPLNRAASERAGPARTLPGTSDTQYLRANSAAAWCWPSTGKVATLMQLRDAGAYTNNWAQTQGGSFVQDRNGELTKFYMPAKTTGSATIPSGTVKRRKGLYAIGYFPGGAEAALGGL